MSTHTMGVEITDDPSTIDRPQDESATRDLLAAVAFTPDALRAWHQLGQALRDAWDRHDHVPCTEDPGSFVSDDAGLRFVAARACHFCPAREACAAFADANGERRYVWGGRDRGDALTRLPTTPRRSAVCRSCGQEFLVPRGRRGRAPQRCTPCDEAPVQQQDRTRA